MPIPRAEWCRNRVLRNVRLALGQLGVLEDWRLAPESLVDRVNDAFALSGEPVLYADGGPDNWTVLTPDEICGRCEGTVAWVDLTAASIPAGDRGPKWKANASTDGDSSTVKRRVDRITVGPDQTQTFWAPAGAGCLAMCGALLLYPFDKGLGE